MGKTYIFGHKNPDADSIISSLVMAEFEKRTGNAEAVACRLGMVNKETEYVLNYAGVEAPELIEDLEDGAEVVIVDTANPGELISNLSNVKIKRVVDHHQVLLNTSYPIFYRAETVGCTETIMYKLYKEYGVEIDKKIAILMLSAIISDTLLFKSPTCTEEDKKIAEELAKIAEINLEEYGMEMLKAGTDLSEFTLDELIEIDSKTTESNGVSIKVAQVNTACIDDVLKEQEELEEVMNKYIAENDIDIFMLLITDIINRDSEAIVLGKKAEIAEKAFSQKIENNRMFLKGVVSRKKQVFPPLIENA